MRKVFKPCGPKIRAAWYFFALVLIALAVPPSTSRAGGAAYEELLLDEALSKKLYDTRQWRALVHYKPSVIHGYKSLIDDPRFFLSPEGSTDPKKELEETIRAFFRADGKGDKHPKCRFIARYSWLKKELGIKEELLPENPCAGFEELMKAINPRSAVLIFPVSHMNSPASMFGHTLLRIDSDYESKLMTYAINYSAFTDETNGFLFAFKGIFGFYEGYFSIMPYYEKIKEYSNLENRDMWEYRLNLTGEEVEKLIMHVWELKDIYSYYYFFDENCSYNLLLLIEAARPDTELTDSLPEWVIPMDTIRAGQGKKIYSGEPAYRPSRATRIRFIEELAGPEYIELAKRAAENGIDAEAVLKDENIGKADKIKTIDLSVEYLQYLYAKKKMDKDSYLKLYLRILGLRSSLGAGVHYDIPVPIPPEKGHGSFLAELGAGEKAGAGYSSLRLRPANHDLMDPDEGYLQGAAISFFDTELRYNFMEEKFSLERLKLLEITSISDVGRFFKPISWKVEAGVFREEFLKRAHRTVFKADGGPGAAYALYGGFLYGFLEPEVKLSSSLDDGYSIGAGVSAGYFKSMTPAWKMQLELKARSFWLGDRHDIYSAELNQRYTLNPSNAVKLKIRREDFDGFYSNEIGVSWSRYF